MEKFVVETKTLFDNDVKQELMELTAGSFRIFKKLEGAPIHPDAPEPFGK